MRQFRLDNAKFVLIILVVAGHLLEQVKGGSPAMEAIYRFLYLFHIPAFAYLSGAVSTAKFDAKTGKRWLATLVLPYLVFQGVYLFIEAKLTHGAFAYRVVQPYWVMWYLLSLATWRVLLPAVMGMRRPIAITSAVALLVGLLPDIGYGFSLSRTFVFLPFFVAGHVLGSRVAGPRWGAVLVLLGLLGVAYWLRGASAFWFYGSIGYGELKVGPWLGVCARAGLLLCGGMGCWAVLRLLPERDGLAAAEGRTSLAVYLLHGIVIKLIAAAGAFAWLARSPWMIVILAPLLVIVLGRVGRPLRPILDYRWLWRAPEADSVPVRPT
jgi:fucose 4-O-acetylase-like acetyltransferase